MKKLSHTAFAGFYFSIVVFIIFGEIFQLQWLYWLTKPVPLLLIFGYFKASTVLKTGRVVRLLMLIAFFLCFTGDFVIMFSERNELFFLTGLILFLLAHILFSASFIYQIKTKVGYNRHWLQLALATFVVVYGAEFFIINRFSFGEMMIPVLLYCAAITVMGVAAALRDLSKPRSSYLKVLIGAIFFIISDSLLATNKFVFEFEFSEPLILGTYFFAQYLITTGIIDNLNHEDYKTQN